MKVMEVSMLIGVEVPARGSMVDMNAAARDLDILAAALASTARTCGAMVMVLEAAPRSRPGKGNSSPRKIDMDAVSALLPILIIGGDQPQIEMNDPTYPEIEPPPPLHVAPVPPFSGSGVPGCGELAPDDEGADPSLHKDVL